MITKILTYEKMNKGNFATGAVGSSILRGKWLVEAWPELTQWNHGDYADELLFQKAYWYSMLQDFPGKRILDLCDPDWMSGSLELKKISGMVDAITCSNDGLTQVVQNTVTHIPVVTVPDRLNLNYFTQKKQHTGKATRVVYFGFRHNAEVVLPQVLPSLARHGLELLIVSNKPVNFYATYGVTVRYVKWNDATAYNDIQMADFAINPAFPNALFRFKSNNKTLVAWGLGLPVAQTAEDMQRFLDPAERTNEAALRWEEIQRDWNITQSVQQFKEPLRWDTPMSDYRQKESPEVIHRRFLALCKAIGFGEIKVEIANGVPKDVHVLFQGFRLDLTDPASDGMLGLAKSRGDSSHDGES